MTVLTKQEMDNAVTAYVMERPGRELTAKQIEADLKGVDRDFANYWLRDRARTQGASHPLNQKVYTYQYAHYVYFPGPVPIDWKDRIRSYRDRKQQTRDYRNSHRALAPSPQAGNGGSVSQGGLFEMLRYYPDTNKVVLADEDGNLWTGTITQVTV